VLTENSSKQAEQGATGQTIDDLSESDSDDGSMASSVLGRYFDPPIYDYARMNRVTADFGGEMFEGNMPVQ